MTAKCPFLLLIIFSMVVSVSPTERKILHIGGIFPMTIDGGGWPGGQACLPAAQLALDHVNTNKDILPGYELQLYYNDSACQPGRGARVMYELLYTGPTKIILLSGCSLVTTVVAEAASMWNLIVLSYGASSPALSNRVRFPTLFRTHPSATIHNPTRVKLLQRFKWNKIAILKVAEEVFAETAKDLERQCSEANIRIVSHQSFYGDPADALKSLKRQDARIIVGLFYEKEARKVFCQAYKDKLYGKRYSWFLIGWYSDTWFNPVPSEGLDCSLQEMLEVVQFHWTTEAIMLNPYDKPGRANLTGKRFEEILTDELVNDGHIRADIRNVGGFVEAPLAYDAIWALALALNCTKTRLGSRGLHLEDFSYENQVILNELSLCMSVTNFEGVSGSVEFGSQGDRIAQTQVEQLQDGVYCKAFTYDSSEGHLQPLTFAHEAGTCEQLRWHDDHKPNDAPEIVHRTLATSKTLFKIVSLLALLSAVICTAAGIFNWENKSKRMIAHSQLQVNNVMVGGCLLAVISVFLWGFPVAELDRMQPTTFGLMCHARVSLLSFGFTCAFSAMFSKIWIVYRFGADADEKKIVSRQKGENVAEDPLMQPYGPDRSTKAKLRLANKPIPISKFYVIVSILCFFDFCVLGAWYEFDKMKLHEQQFEKIPDLVEDRVIIPFIRLCKSRNMNLWAGLTIIPKAVLAVITVFLSYESRNLRLRYVNDSRNINLAVYNVFILSSVTTPILLFLVHNQPDAQFIFIAASVLLCVLISLALVFLPKVMEITRNGHNRHSAADPTTKDKTNDLDRNHSPKRRCGFLDSDQGRKERLAQDIQQLRTEIKKKDEFIFCLRRRVTAARERVAQAQGTMPERDSIHSEYVSASLTTATVHKAATNQTNTQLASDDDNNTCIDWSQVDDKETVV